MGEFFKDLFSSWGWKVESYDIVPERSTVSLEQISSFDIIFLSAPVHKIPDLLEEIAPYIQKDSLLIDISSVKRGILSKIENLECEQLILHPLFGPDMEVQASSIAVLKCEGDTASHVLNMMRKSGIRLFDLGLNDHDGKMALLQGLPVLSLLFIPYYLSKKGLLDEACMGTTNLKVIFELSSRIVHGNPETYDVILKNLFQMEKELGEEFCRFIKVLKDDGIDGVISDLRNELNGELHRIIAELSKLKDVDPEICDLRSAINVIDLIILSMIERRVEFAKILGELKVFRDMPVVAPDIEKERLQRIVSRSKLNSSYLKSIFRDIIELTKIEELEHLGFIERIAVLGPEGSFSEEAGLKLTGSKTPLVYCSTISEVFSSVENGEVELGLVPIENSLEGLVGATFDELVVRDVKVIGEVSVSVELCLAGITCNLKEIKAVYSHPVAIGQCSGFIHNKLPHVEIKFTSSTSEAVKIIGKDSAAIISKNAVLHYGLDVIEDSIQDSKGATTRFYIISKDTKIADGPITSLIFSVRDESGALVRVLKYFEDMDINMRLLVSRPSRIHHGEYLFLVEVERSLKDEEIGELSKRTDYLKVLGRFSPVRNISDLIELYPE